MKVLVIGGGGREHAIAWKLSQSKQVDAIFAAPGNPGIASLGECLQPASQAPAAYLALADETGADLTVVGPEAPLVAGVVDLFRAANKRIVGPTAAAARLEGSKVFSKAFMVRAGIPTAAAETASGPAHARELLGAFTFPLVLKADGLAAGKGVIIAQDRAEAIAALDALPPGHIVLEEFLRGEEVSFIVYSDGDRAVPLEATQDHKATFDGDQGPNTGGMGAYCDGRILTPAQTEAIMRDIIAPTLAQAKAEAMPYTGFLYAGLMMTDAGPKVLEFNARLGDPEAQALLHRMDSDLLDLFLDCEPPTWKPDPSVCIVLAAEGYPGTPRRGDTITISGSSAPNGAARPIVFHAGTTTGPTGLQTAGGRVLGVTASGQDLPTAIANTYSAVSGIRFSGMQFRTDIGKKGLKRW